MDRRFWDADDDRARLHFRARNMIGRATLRMVDDTGPIQLHQIEAYTSEVHDKSQFPGHPGFGAVPLPGAKLVTLHQGGYRSMNSVMGLVDPRYRPTGHQPGESYMYMVDGASASDGTGGTMRKIIEGLAGWVHNLFGKTINVGDSNTQTIVVGGTGVTSLMIKVSGSTQVTVQGGTGSPLAVKRIDDSPAVNLFTT